MNVLQIVDILDDHLVNDTDKTNERTSCDLIMFPPKERAGEESGSDSDDEDAPEATWNKLPRKMLESGNTTTIFTTTTTTTTTTTILGGEVVNNGVRGLDEDGVIRALENLEGTRWPEGLTDLTDDDESDDDSIQYTVIDNSPRASSSLQESRPGSSLLMSSDEEMPPTTPSPTPGTLFYYKYKNYFFIVFSDTGRSQRTLKGRISKDSQRIPSATPPSTTPSSDEEMPPPTPRTPSTTVASTPRTTPPFCPPILRRAAPIGEQRVRDSPPSPASGSRTPSPSTSGTTSAFTTTTTTSIIFVRYSNPWTRKGACWYSKPWTRRGSCWNSKPWTRKGNGYYDSSRKDPWSWTCCTCCSALEESGYGPGRCSW